jgi:RNA polymerase sigma-70 factor (sigma-E family)
MPVRPTAESLFTAHFPAMCRLALLLLRDPAVAEEVTMDAFVAACSGWRRVEAAEQPDAYLRRIVVNLCCSRLRRRVAERRAHARFGRADTVAPPWDPTVDERSRAVLAAVASLPDRQRACVVLHYFEDLRVAEVAAVLGCSTGTVKSQLAKARTTLGRALRLYEPDAEADYV